MDICLADTAGQRNWATRLINKAYSWRGYGDRHTIKCDDHYTTFTASSGGGVIGTLTLGVDSPARLGVDETFGDVVDRFRCVPDVKLCELTKLAFEVNRSSKPLLASLFHVIFIYGWNKYGCTDLLIEVNPRHSRFYEAMLGFSRVGEVRTNDGVGAPAQLMHLEVAEIRARITRHAGQAPESSRTLYPYFFKAAEERGIYERLVRSLADRKGWYQRPARRIPDRGAGRRENLYPALQ